MRKLKLYSILYSTIYPFTKLSFGISIITLFCALPLLSQPKLNNTLDQIEGTWEIDLRQSPDSNPYLKEFTISLLDDTNFEGEFYNSTIKDGFLNTNWPNIQFAFTTSDKSNSYYHSGYYKNDTLYGISYCPNREFAMPWKGSKIKENSVNSTYKEIDALFESLESEGKFNGIALIGNKDSVLFSQSYGYSEMDMAQKIDVNTQFYIASLSKQFTVTAILLLQEDKLLKLDQRVSEFIDDFPYPDINISNLLSNTSGVIDYIDFFAENWNKGKQANTDDVIDYLKTEKPQLLFEQGDKMEYSNTNFVLLAKIIELVSKESYAHYIENNIFKPCGMTRTYASSKPYFNKMDSNVALGYVMEENSPVKAEYSSIPHMDRVNYLSGIQGDGSIVTSINDLFLWHQSLCSELILSKASKDLMFTPYTLNDQAASNYGFGWYVEGSIVDHTGYWPGYQTRIIRNLKTGLVGITFKNVETNYWNWLLEFDRFIK